jgi:hypothetical protein
LWLEQENELFRSKVAKLEETIASKEDKLKTQGEEMQRIDKELAERNLIC